MATVKHPMIFWAQRKATLMMTIAVEDVKIETLEFKDNVFTFKGTDKAGQSYEAKLNLYGKIDGEQFHKVDTCRQLEFVVGKSEPDWWPRLLKESAKVQWIKVDFNKWVDEEDEAEEEPPFDFGGDFGTDFDPSKMDFGADDPPELEDIEMTATAEKSGIDA